MSIDESAPTNNYYDNVNQTLLESVDPSARVICELGCGGGALARAIRNRIGQPLHYVGVELMADALERAKPVLDVAVQCNLDEASDWSQHSALSAALPEATFDHVICGDVLEHLYAPEDVVAQAAKRLKPGGSLLTCIPNVQHWSVVAQLLCGTWPRLDAGLFDRTHIRWFCLADMIQLLTGAGLQVERVIPRVFNPEEGMEILEYLEPLAQHLGVNPEIYYQQSLPLQYVLVAKRVQ